MTNLATLTARTPALPCRVDPGPFFADSSTERAAAVRLCQSCPLQQPCAGYAIETRQTHGVWGGTTAADRRSFWDGKPWRFDEVGRLRLVCGSERAYLSHFGYREQPCEACVRAHEEHVTAARRGRLAVEHGKGGSTVGYFLHRRLGEPACAECLAANAAQSRTAKAQRGARRGRARSRAASGTSGAREIVSGAPAGVQRRGQVAA
ncbi:WhiB family transcriptional regulator [Streptomyces sp. NPDC060235]|uniref:WhiB family transcriptional regulator n=1 Tax=Streptomyces sp. NPDC060235 TaxID=3347080 RepID=UPI00366583C4